MTKIFRGKIPVMQPATRTTQIHRPFVAKAFALCTALCCTFTASITHAADYRLTAADVTAIQALARTLFEAGRDGSAERLRTVIPSREEYLAIFQPDLPMLADRHQRIVEQDVRGLRTTFATGTYVSLDPSIAVNRSLRVDRCGRVAVRGSQCVNGPRIEYRLGSSRRYFRIDRLVRLSTGVWKIFDARM